MARAERTLRGLVQKDSPIADVLTDDVAHTLPSFGQLWDAVQASLDELYARDMDLLGTTERAVVGRLMVYLDRHLAALSSSGLVIDQDYERAGQATKRLTARGMPDKKIVPDLIFHRRRDLGPTGNVLAIEVKTDRRADGRLHDFAKLSVLTGHVTTAIAYGKYLRLHGDRAPEGQARTADVSLPLGMSPYKYGIWLLLEPRGTECWWWSNGKAPQPLNYMAPTSDLPSPP